MQRDTNERHHRPSNTEISAHEMKWKKKKIKRKNEERSIKKKRRNERISYFVESKEEKYRIKKKTHNNAILLALNGKNAIPTDERNQQLISNSKWISNFKNVSNVCNDFVQILLSIGDLPSSLTTSRQMNKKKKDEVQFSESLTRATQYELYYMQPSILS